MQSYSKEADGNLLYPPPRPDPGVMDLEAVF